MVKFISIFILMLSFSSISAQNKELNLQIGDTVTFVSNCDSGTFNYIDLYTKTRYLDSNVVYDTLTGDGFYQAFFFDGDFNAERLPCSYSNQKFIITSAQYFTDNKTKEDRLVVFVRLESWDKVAWIEFIDAYEASEVLLKE